MSVQEQEQTKERYYREAIRCMDEAREYLKNAEKEDNFYVDRKIVKKAFKTVYGGFLVALEGFFTLNGLKPKAKERKSVEFYQHNIAKIDKGMQIYLENAFKILLLLGYVDGASDAVIIEHGFDFAYTLIDKIKPSKSFVCQ